MKMSNVESSKTGYPWQQPPPPTKNIRTDTNVKRAYFERGLEPCLRFPILEVFLMQYSSKD